MGDPQITYSQKDRLLNIKTADGLTELLLERFDGAEELSRPFEFKLTMLSTNEMVDLGKLLRTAVTIGIVMTDGKQRYFHAHFRSITHAKEGDDVMASREKSGISNPSRELIVYEAVVVPKLWFLSLDSDCRIFQEKTVPEIVEKVLKDKGVTDFRWSLNSTYRKREYCVQYRESSLDFISRLLEEEGIFYFFEHTDAKHTLVMADKSSVQGTCPGQPVAQYSYGDNGWVDGDQDGIATLERIQAAFTGQAALTDYNFETPKNSLLSKLPGRNEEAFDYPGEYGAMEEGDFYVRVRMEELEARQFILNGSGRCRAFRPGYNFKLKGHYRADTNQDYFLTKVTHECYDSTYRQDRDKSHHYSNTFTAIPKTVTYRPPRDTERPTVQGLQPAVVVGQSGEEIWVDKYGRVKVQFFWDRQGRKDENSSCWCRVSQIWAGKNWGWVTIPRIGQEVLVDFLEGDPDQPIIVGRVYNADQMPPYALPGNQTQSGIKTRSSKGGGAENFNELRFEDLKGSELINVQAEKDMTTLVKHDDTQTVKNDRKIDVLGTHTETIVKDTTIKITEGNHSTTVVQGNQSITLNQGNQSTSLDMGNQSVQLKMGNQSTTCDLGKIDMTAMQSITLTVGESSIRIDQMGVTIQGLMIKISGEAITTVEGEAMLELTGGITMINT